MALVVALVIAACGGGDSPFVPPGTPPPGQPPPPPPFADGAVVFTLDTGASRQLWAYDRRDVELVNLGVAYTTAANAMSGRSHRQPPFHIHAFGGFVRSLVRFDFPDGGANEFSDELAGTGPVQVLALGGSSGRMALIASTEDDGTPVAQLIDSLSPANPATWSAPAGVTGIGDGVFGPGGSVLLQVQSGAGVAALVRWNGQDGTSGVSLTGDLGPDWRVVEGGFGMLDDGWVGFAAMDCTVAPCEIGMFRVDPDSPAGSVQRLDPADQGFHPVALDEEVVSPDGRAMAWLYDGRLRVVDTDGGAPAVEVTASGTVWPNYRYLYQSSRLAFLYTDADPTDGRLMVYDPSDGSLVQALGGLLVGSYFQLGRWLMDFSIDGRFVAVQSSATSIALIDLTGPSTVATYDIGTPVRQFALSADGAELFVVTPQHFQVWNATGDLVEQLPVSAATAVNRLEVLP